MKVKKLLLISSSWCGPCKLLKKELEGFDYVPIEKFDIDDDEIVADLYHVRSVPTLIFLDEKLNEIERNVGFMKKDKIIDKINELNDEADK